MTLSEASRSVVIIQARVTSSRLPGKVLLPLGTGTVLGCVLQRATRIPGVDLVQLAVPDGPEHQPIVDIAASHPGVGVSRGPEADVLRRYAIAAEASGADFIVRITSDCPLIDPEISGQVLSAARLQDGYARTSFNSGAPLGLDTEAMPARILFAADREAKAPQDREHVTPFIWSRPDRFPATYIDREPDRRSWRLTLDEQSDYELISKIYEILGDGDTLFGLAEIEALLIERPELLELNKHVNHTPAPRVLPAEN